MLNKQGKVVDDVYVEQRKKQTPQDGARKKGWSDNEYPAMDGSLSKAAKHLDRQDKMEHYNLGSGMKQMTETAGKKGNAGAGSISGKAEK